MRDDERKRKTIETFGRAAASYGRVGPAYFAQVGERLVELAQLTSGAHVLDVASGRGAVLIPAAEQVGTNGRVIGIDLAEEMVAHTSRDIEQRGLKQVEMRKMDAEILAFPDGTFDYLLSGFSLFFYPRIDHTLAEFRRVLKPAGRIGVSTWGKIDERWNWYWDLSDAYLDQQSDDEDDEDYPFDNAAGMEALLSAAGFIDIQTTAEVTEIVYADVEEWWAAQWSHGGRAALDQMSPEMLERFKAEALEKIRGKDVMQADGLYRVLRVLYSVGSKPGD